eukprot:COSAG02_NODE_6652_length_3435_cov_2.810252_2_plen_101_part_00
MAAWQVTQKQRQECRAVERPSLHSSVQGGTVVAIISATVTQGNQEIRFILSSIYALVLLRDEGSTDALVSRRWSDHLPPYIAQLEHLPRCVSTSGAWSEI